MKQQLEWDEETNKVYLVTEYDDGSISSEPISNEEAAEWQSANKY